jgi:SagB-type dehydrogenase family enzyme
MTNPIGREFMEMSKYKNMGPTEEQQGIIPQPPLELPYPPGKPLIYLAAPAGLKMPAMDLREAVERRVTLRKYSETSLSLDELSYLLWTTQGVKRITKRPATLRPVPSAGARHAFETYLLANLVEGLDPGLYRFAASEHALVNLEFAADINEQITHACTDQNQVRTSAATFIWVAVAERMTWRYSQRGYRYLHLDAGHVCQNLYLAAEQIGCGVCAIAAFDDDLLNAALKLDGERLFAIYVASVGKRT